MNSFYIPSATPPTVYYDTPYGPVLWIIAILDLIVPSNVMNWRDYIPFGLADKATNGPFSYTDVLRFFRNTPDTLSFAEFRAGKNEACDDLFCTNNPAEAVEGDCNHTVKEMMTFCKSLFVYAFQTTSTDLSRLSTPLALCTVLLLVLGFRYVKSILLPYFSSIGRDVGRKKHGELWVCENEEKIVKFGEYVFRLLYHSSISIYGIFYFYDKPWWQLSEADNTVGGTMHLWLDYPQPVQPGMAWYYLIQFAYNVDAFISLVELSFQLHINWHSGFPLFDIKLLSPPRTPANDNCNKSVHKKDIDNNIHKDNNNGFITIQWKDTVRGDFREMMIHHIVTNLLVYFSSVCLFTRVGSMVFIVHDISDVPVDLSKLCNFVQWKTATTYCFITLLITWVITRIYTLTFVIYYSILFEIYALVTDESSALALKFTHFCFYILVGTLISLHVYWFFVIAKIGYVLLTKGKQVDYSVHKNGVEEKEKRN